MKRKTIIISSLVGIIGLLALMVWALTVDTTISNVALVSPIARQNISGNLIVNISAAHISGGDGNITNATVRFANASNQVQFLEFVFVDSNRARNTSLSNLTTEEGTSSLYVDTTNSENELADGYYNISIINATNASESDLGGQNGSYDSVIINTTVIKVAGSDSQQAFIIIDNTRPQLVGAGNFTDRTNYTGNNEVNLTITVTNNTGDLNSGTDIHRVTAQIYNGSNLFNLSYSLKNGGAALAMNRSYNLSFNWSGYNMVDGNYTVRFFVNDTAGNLNGTNTASFILDTTGPSATVTCTPSSATVGGVVTCTCAGSDGTNSSGVASVALADSGVYQATTAGTFTSATCTATDNVGLTGTDTATYTVTAAASTSGGGSGGSSGGVSSGTVGQFEKKTWASVLAGEKATLPVKNGVLGVTSIEFVVEKTTYGATLQVKKVDTLPTTVKSFEQKTYKTLQITETNVEKALSGNAVINFKVEKKWLADNGLAASQVSMFHFKDDAWVALPTTVGQDDGTYVHFAAETPGFSYFVIGQNKAAAPPASVVKEEAPAVEEVPTEVTQPPVTEEQEEPSRSSAAVWVVIGLVLVALLAWAVLSLRKRR